MGALGEHVRLAATALALGARVGGRRISARAKTLVTPFGRAPEKILIAPQDLRTADATRAGEIYSGSFAFAGKTIETAGASPFLVEPPSGEWSEALHGFGWLRHLRAAETTLARSNARALVDEWIATRGGPDAASLPTSVSARRLISWLSHSPLILDGADKAFYRRFLKSLARQARQLAGAAGSATDGAPRLTAAAALAYAGLCLSGEQRLQRAASAFLVDELDRQILADGGHVSRNPAELVQILLDLIPLRQIYAARNVQTPPRLVTAIDRMVPMLRFFRHGDGEFAQFNGAGPTSTDLVATILAHDDARGQPVDDAPHSGYQRLSAGASLLLVDAGEPPPFAVSDHAHAGCLSFEFSAGPERIVVNCGAPRFGRADWERAARATAAHSTLSIGEESSSRFASEGWRRLVGPRIVSGPTPVVANRTRDLRGVTVAASHDGYAALFGVAHERALTLSDDGLRFSGEDTLRPVPGAAFAAGAPFTLRFHLHPSIRASLLQDAHGVILALPSGAAWSFAAPGHAVTLEESVYLASPTRPRRTDQITIHGALSGPVEIAWTFERMPTDPAVRRRMPAVEEFDALPL